MRTWLKDNAAVIGGIAGTIAAIIAVLQVLVVNPMNQRFDDQNRYIEQRFDQQDRYVEQRFDQQDERLDRLTDEVSELRALVTGIIERVSRNEGEIDVIRQQLQTVDAP